MFKYFWDSSVKTFIYILRRNACDIQLPCRFSASFTERMQHSERIRLESQNVHEKKSVRMTNSSVVRENSGA